MTSTIRRRLAAALGGAVLLAAPLTLLAATPSSGTLTGSSGALTYSAGPFLAPNVTGAAGTTSCAAPMSCDDYALTLNVPASGATRQLRIQAQWPVFAADFDVYLLDSQGGVLASAASTSDPETIRIDLPANVGRYTVRIVPYLPLAQTVTATIDLVTAPLAPSTGAGATAAGSAPRFHAFVAPNGLGDNAGEPSYRVDWKVNKLSLKHDQVNTGGVGFFQSGPNTLRVSHDDCSSPALDLWEDVSTPFVQQFALSDPIGYVDHTTGRVFSLDLIGGQGNSFMAHSDDDGDSFTPDQGGGILAGPDHQTLGGGPFPADFPLPHPLYPNAVYYCSQDIAPEAQCSVSLDGGQTFLPAVPIFNPVQCLGGIHGHVKVGPDGAAYVPNSACSTGGGNVGNAVSLDGGFTWNAYTVPGSASDLDPAVAIGADNTVYMGWVTSGNGSPHVAVSHDHGQTWVNETDLGKLAGIVHSNFVVATAGDGDRAAIGFIGSSATGDSNAINSYRGVWHMYIATTYDGGRSWSVVDTTPTDPVQVGSVCTSGTTCGADRNLLDFNDLDVDAEGRIVLGFADGCLPPACTEATAAAHAPPYDESRANKASLIRQAGGRRLFARFDPVEPAVPAAPLLNSAVRTASGSVNLSWKAPDHGGSPLTAYRIYRGVGSSALQRIAEVDASKPAYIDSSALPNTAYVYKVTAVNAVGEGTSCRSVGLGSSGVVETPCTGITVAVDSGTNDATDMQANHDLVSVAAAYPYVDGKNDPLVFTLKVASLSTLTPRTFYFASFANPAGVIYGVRMSVDVTGKVSFVSYKAGANNSGGVDGRFVDTSLPARSESSYSADGTITIAINPADVGAAAGQTLTGFNGGVGLDGTTPAGGVTQILDGVPDNALATRVGSFKLDNGSCRPNTAPIAVLNATPNSGTAPLQVTLSGVDSSDADHDAISNYHFDFGDGSAGIDSSSATVQYTYTNAGVYAARLTVTDARGAASNVAQTMITVNAADGGTSGGTSGGSTTGGTGGGTGGNGSETVSAQLSATPTSGNTPLQVLLDASGSNTAEGTPITSYTFYPGDGSSPITTDSATLSFTYTAAGNFDAQVVVRNAHGYSATSNAVRISATTTIDVQPSGRTVAALVVTPTSGSVPLTVRFDGSRSFAANGRTISSYTFDFGDGQSITQSGPVVTHVYTVAGTYSPSLSVTDSAGQPSAEKAVASVRAIGSDGRAPQVTPASSRRGGAFGLALLPLLAAGLLRRRRRA